MAELVSVTWKQEYQTQLTGWGLPGTGLLAGCVIPCCTAEEKWVEENVRGKWTRLFHLYALIEISVCVCVCFVCKQMQACQRVCRCSGREGEILWSLFCQVSVNSCCECNEVWRLVSESKHCCWSKRLFYMQLGVWGSVMRFVTCLKGSGGQKCQNVQQYRVIKVSSWFFFLFVHFTSNFWFLMSTFLESYICKNRKL